MDMTITPELIGIIFTAAVSVLTCAYVFGGLTKGLKSLESRMDKFEATVSDMNVRLGRVEGTLAIAGNSPLKHTPAGKIIFDDIDGTRFVEHNYKALSEYVTASGARNKYDIQQEAIKAVESIADAETLAEFKDYAYDKGWSVDQIYNVLGIYLRDKYLLERGVPNA